MSEAVFKRFYKNLNPEQREAVDAIEGPVMVIAGPGTGKTTVLTLRIANILRQTDTEPECILALTFTEAATANMRRRLAELVGSVAYQVIITTFHSFCNDSIQSYPEEFPHIIGSHSITEVDQIQIIESLLQNAPHSVLKPFGNPLHYTREILAKINILKREGVEAEEFARIVKKERRRLEQSSERTHKKGPHKGKPRAEHLQKEREVEKQEKFADIYAKYQEELGKRNVYDYNDMIVETLRVLGKNKRLLQILRERFQYVLVDEHQDTNNAQNKVLEKLLDFHTNPNIFVVGDEKQAIFRFQGASLENFLHFKTLYPEARVISLKENYRSQETILRSAESILPTKVALRAGKGHVPKNIAIIPCANMESEAYVVASMVKESVEAGTRPEEVAILVRENKDANLFARTLERLKVPHRVESDENILEDSCVRAYVKLLRALERPGDEEALAEALHLDSLGIEPLDIWKMLRRARKERASLYDMLKKEEQKIFNLFSKWKRQSKNRSLRETLESVLEESGILEEVLGGEKEEEHMAALRVFVDEAHRFIEARRGAGLGEFLNYLETLEEHNVLMRQKPTARTGKVRLMTAHRAKGLEFEEVFMTGVYHTHWGGRRRPELLPLPTAVFQKTGKALTKEEKDEDERRLFYVALTRAKKRLVISYPKERVDGRELLPAGFIEEIRSELKDVEEPSVLEESYEHKWLARPAQKKGGGLKKSRAEHAYISELFDSQGLSVSALNNYLECPWKYFYLNLIRVPKLPEPHQMFGTAVHAALRDFFEHLKNFGGSTPETLLSRFAHHLEQQPLERRRVCLKEDASAWKKRGEEALGGWHKAYKGSWTSECVTELSMRGVECEGVLLSGKLDKLEFVDRAGGVLVTDYKTGKPKSRNDMLGRTKTSNGDIFRQIVFYNLLLDIYKKGKFRFKGGLIDFVEPNERGKYKKEEFEVTTKEKKELAELIKKTASEIRGFKFQNAGCREKTCKYCNLRALSKRAR